MFWFRFVEKKTNVLLKMKQENIKYTSIVIFETFENNVKSGLYNDIIKNYIYKVCII